MFIGAQPVNLCGGIGGRCFKFFLAVCAAPGYFVVLFPMRDGVRLTDRPRLRQAVFYVKLKCTGFACKALLFCAVASGKPAQLAKGNTMPKLDFTKAEFATSVGNASQLQTQDRPEFVFAGRSNVGKSSLINKLANRKRLARISATPGKTATINFYTAGDVYLVDLPGYGYAKVSDAERKRWDRLIDGYFAAGREISLLLQLLDCRHAPSKDDVQMLEYLSHYHIPFVAVLTKADKVKPSQHAKIIAEFTDTLALYNCKGILLVSAEKGTGIPELAQCMREALPQEDEG